MKKLFIFFILSLICFKLSALIYPAGFLNLHTYSLFSDTTKISRKDSIKIPADSLLKDSLKSHATHPKDSIKTADTLFHKDSVKISPTVLKDSVRIMAFANRPDSLKSVDTLNKKDSLKFTLTATQKDSVNAKAFANKPDSLNLSALINKADSMGGSDNAHLVDSLNHIVIVKRQDSLKWAHYKHAVDSVKLSLATVGIDSLKKMLTHPENDLFKGPIYGEIATRYFDYDTLSDKRIRLDHQSGVLNYTMKALHQYSRYNDTAGLRTCFDNLATVYIAQKKFSQAKWFILQSNTLSRSKHDVLNIISSLITLSSIKSEQNDYTLAMRDLNEALQLSIANHYPKIESNVLRYYALLYSRMKNYPKEAIVLKKRDSLDESIRKDEEAKLLAVVAAKDSAENKKTDSLQVKKKVFTSSTKKLSKSNSSKKTASL
jgi:tetratricopeptide (TPR) repeat protein